MSIKTNVKATNITLTPSISEYIGKKLESLEKFFGEEDEVLVNVEVGKVSRHHKSGDIFRAEIKLNYSGNTHYAASEEEDLYMAIDEVKDEIIREFTSKRKKALRLVRRGGLKIKNLLKGVRDAGGRGWRRFRRK